MFVKNSFEYDARVTKEAKTLIDAGHEVTVVALHVPGVTEREETTLEGIGVVRVERVQLGVGALNRLAAKYAGVAEEQRASLTGSDPDPERARARGTISPASTATPGDAVEVRVEPRSADPPPRGLERVWKTVSTALLEGVLAVAKLGFRVVRGLLGRQGRWVKHWAINRRMIRVGLDSGADVFCCHDLNTLYVGTVCKRKTGKPLVYDSHELATERNRMGFWWKTWATFTERRWIPQVDALIVASPSWISEIERKHRHLPPITETVINVPYARPFEPKDLKGAVGLPADLPVLVYQGSIQENRGIEPAIDAVDSMENVGMVVIGYGYHRPALEELVRSRGLSDRIKFFGPVPNDELIAWTAGADVGLCNIVNSSLSYHTSLPNKLFEYIHAGIPVIGSDSPEIGRIVTETGVGEVCDASDPEGIAAAARKILSDPDPYRAAAPAAAERYRWQVEADKLLAVYARLGA